MIDTATKVEQNLAAMRRLCVATCAVILLTVIAFTLIEDGRAELFFAIGGIAATAILYFRAIPTLTGLVEDIHIDAQQARAEARAAINNDPLTGLANRKAGIAHLNMLLSNAARHGFRVGVALIDVKSLRRINADHGRETGDRCLRRAAAIIRTEVRKGDFTARLGEREFLVIFAHSQSEDDLATVVSRIIERIERPFDVNGSDVSLTCTSGLAISKTEEMDAERLIADAGIALQSAYQTGAEYALLNDQLRMNSDASLAARADLNKALKTGAIVPWFQPQVSLADGTLVGVEALARWEHPERGTLSPGTFLPIAEEFGLIERVDEAILDQSLDAVRRWRDNGLNVPRVSVNLSARHLNDPFLTERIKWALDIRDLNPDCLCIEVLESVLITKSDSSIRRNIESLVRIGVQIDLDDFGTGHSSITTLDCIPAHRIKIDRAFVSGIDQDPKRQTFVRAMVDLAKPLNIQVLAEGVETPAEKEKVTALGCTEVQGFGIARPMDAEKLANWVRSGAKAEIADKPKDAKPPRLKIAAGST